MKTVDNFVMVPLLVKGIEPAPRWTRADYLLIGAVTLVGLALRIPGLNQGLWIDEYLTFFAWVRSPAAAIINAVGHSNNHVFYSLCAHFAVAWLGESIWTLRLPAVVFGVAAIPVLYHLGRQLASREEAFLAAVFLALNYQFVWYSQNARGYTGLFFGALLSSILFIRLLASPSPSVRLILGYAVLAALTAWIHLTAVFVILAHGFVWLVLASKPNRAGQRASVLPTFMALLLTGILTQALYAPLFLDKDTYFTRVGDGTSGFVAELEDDTDRVLSAAATWVLSEYAQGLQRSVPGGWPVVAIVVLVLLTGIGSYFRQSVLVGCLLLFPLLATVLMFYFRGHLLFPRFLFGSAGFLLLLVVRGGFVSAGLCLPFLSRRQVLLIGGLVALAGLMLVPAAWKPKQDFAGAAEFMVQHRAPGDAVVCLMGLRSILQGYFGVECVAVNSPAELDQIEQQHQRIWLIYHLPTQFEARLPQIWKRVQGSSGYVRVSKFPGTLNGGDIIVLLKQQSRPDISPDISPGIFADQDTGQ